MLKDRLTKEFDDNLIDHITYKQWIAVDRSTLETISKPSDEFVETICEKVEILLAKQQAAFYNECKSTLKNREVIVTTNIKFSENYPFVLQEAAQGFHWNNAQATIHPFVVYFMISGKLSHLSFVIISDCLHHGTVAVHLYQKKLIGFLKPRLPYQLKKIIYFSDGAASQYKNRKNFINLCHHESDFGVDAEWHFSATSHGKGACDGVGGTVKRLAARASLQRPYEDQIMTPLQLYEWASKNIPGVIFNYCGTEEYEEEKAYLEDCFEKAHTITGTANCILTFRFPKQP